MSDKPYTAIMVSETHWDRAWYQPFETFRIRLVRLIDRVIEILDRDPTFKSFMLDGQMLPIEDYLAIRPERRGDLERLVRAGRLLIGPWYALADEYLVSPEALIRNLMVGLRLAGGFGGVMREGYVPDAFGHIAQLPQILQGFGIGSAVFWRGVGDEGEALGDQFWWDAPDGSRVLALHLPDGYHNASNLGYPMRWGDPSALEYDAALALRQLRAAIDLLKPRTRVPLLLLMNGIDHAEADPNAPNVIRQANPALADAQIEHDSLPNYVARVRAMQTNLDTFCGEFNRGRYAVILQGVYSTRIHLKLANQRVQTLLERYADPLAAWAWALGAPHPTAFLNYAWAKLLQNHPHDDICGCSVDAVHSENMTRYADAEQVAAVIARDSFRAVVGQIDRAAQPGVPFVLFNPLAWPFSGAAELELLFDRFATLADDFRLVDAAGRPVPCQVLGRDEHFDMEILKANRKRAVRVALAVHELPACGYRVYFAQPAAGQPAPAVAAPVELIPGGANGAGGMANRYLRVQINPDGTLDVTDKMTGRRFRQQAYLEDTEDAGDEYDYSPARHSQTVASFGGRAKISLAAAGPLQTTYKISLRLALPTALSADRQQRRGTRVNCPLTLTVTLRHDSRQVALHVEVDNRARDHRLRLCFPTDLETDRAAAGGHFDVIERVLDQPAGAGWQQPPVPTKHQRGFVDVSDGRAGLAVFSRGLPEYEVLADGHNTIAVTLLRCVDAISRGDLLTRPSHAGIPCDAPAAQCLGRYAFELALRPHAGDWRAVYREAEAMQAALYLRRGDETEGYLPDEVWRDNSPDVLLAAAKFKPRKLTGELPAELSFLSIAPDVLALSIVKRSEDGHALVVRCYNPTPEPQQATLRLFRPVRRACLLNLNEDAQQELPAGGSHEISFAVGGKQVRTLGLTL